ncbi:unnamed protein product, partial [Onchocerca ochengi]|uniref:RGM_C domain-containing protein n=1 Tax=Onchocerca ochengi TaxID=42157 RepID=A0A182ES18_ONCOC
TKDCERFTTCAQVELLGDGPRNVKVQMHRISENVARADFKFLAHIGSIPVDVEKTSRTPTKRRRKKTCNHTPEKRSKEQRRHSLTTENPVESASGNALKESFSNFHFSRKLQAF